MTVLTVYNHTANLIRTGLVTPSSTLIVNLYSVLPANATATTKTAAESGATQLATANGYTQNAKTITGLASETVTTNDSRTSCNQILWTASGGSIAAAFAMIYVDSLTDDPPLYRYDFEGTITAPNGIPFVIDFPNGLDLLERI
jgi:hypothetical protein